MNEPTVPPVPEPVPPTTRWHSHILGPVFYPTAAIVLLLVGIVAVGAWLLILVLRALGFG